jgi:hypothetical protein
MSGARQQLDQIIAEREGESAADGLADVVEEYIEFGGSGDDYFASLLRLPSPLRELYAALIFNSTVRFDGLPFAIPRYDHPGFMMALRDGFTLLREERLLSLVERARKHLSSEGSAALHSDTPNVTFDREAPEISNEAYFAAGKGLMPAIGEYLKSHRQAVLAAASQLDKPGA